MFLSHRDGRLKHLPTRPRQVYDITGAGDMVMSVLGMALAAGADYEAAIADGTEAVRLDPHNPLAYTQRGSAYADKREYDRAVADFTEAIRLNAKNAEYFVNRAKAFDKLEEPDKAKVDRAKAKELGAKVANP